MYTLIRKYITGFASIARGELVMFGLNSLNIGEEALSGMTNKRYCGSGFTGFYGFCFHKPRNRVQKP